jgi:hypothetical protein
MADNHSKFCFPWNLLTDLIFNFDLYKTVMGPLPIYLHVGIYILYLHVKA